MTFRYGLGGTAFGFMFPAIAIAVDALYVRPGSNPLDLVAGNPLHWIILLAPFVLGSVFAYLGRHAEKLASENSRRARLEGQLREAAFRDSLTGLHNRAALVEDLRGQEGGVSGRYLLLLDLDRFKFVNDTMGHGAGDALLRGVADRLRKAALGKGRAYRLGGDEFLVVLEPCTREQAAEFARELVRSVSATYDLGVGNAMASASLGIAPVEREDDDRSSALFNADLALYEAKRTRERIAFFDGSMSRVARDRLSLELDLRKAIANDELLLEYQPIVVVADGSVQGFEALLRWQHPDRGRLAPAEFVPVAESSGLIVTIGLWVLERACRAAARWPAHLGLAVNVSIEQLGDDSFVDAVKECLAVSGLAPGRLTLEVTESLFVQDADRLCWIVAALREHGVRFALDDFGTGYSSISHLRSCQLDQIKIDRSFAARMNEEAREARLVGTMVQLGSAFSLPATIEGIETREAFELARDAGIDYAQGFLFAGPMSESQLSGYLAGTPHDLEPYVAEPSGGGR